jgi:hypothetical protein
MPLPNVAELLAPVPVGNAVIETADRRIAQPWFAWLNRVRDLLAGIAAGVQSGSGSPEGVLFAPPGTVFRRTDGTFPALWVKESAATLSTGWRAL